MKLKLVLFLPVLLLAVVVAGYVALPRRDAAPPRLPAPSSGGTMSADPGTKTPETSDPRLPASAERRDDRTPKGSAGGLIDRLLDARDPGEMGRLAEQLAASRLGPEDLERLRAMARAGTSAHLRRIAVELLSKLSDPDGKNLAAIREAAGASEELVSHGAVSALRDYVRANPSAAPEVNGWLLDRARASIDEETRQVAVTAIEYDTLTNDQARSFVALLHDGSEEVRCSAVHVIGRSAKRPEAMRLLADAFVADPSERVKREIVETLAEMGREARDTLASLRGRSRELDPEIDEALKRLDAPE
ncbi:MAG: HEAT repeat domain-containing protein [Planctomycetes bacterium]|nr:HEAT repeat domain-containing protein [Planctomycetota bacterium]